MLRARSFAGALVAAASLAACSDESGPNISGIDPIAISRIELAPSVDTIFVGDTVQSADRRQYLAAVIGRTGGLMNGVELVWSTADGAVALVSPAGLVTPVAPGETVVRASAGKVGEARLVVAYATSSITVAPSESFQAVAGDTVRLRPQARDRNGLPVRGVAYRYTTSAAGGGGSASVSSVATVDAAGLVTLTGPGTATITVTGGDVSVPVTITVLPRRFQSGAQMVSAGGDFTCGLLPLGRAYCWGQNDFSQLAATGDTTCFNDLNGGGATPCSLEALPVAGGHTFTQLTAGGYHACGLDTGGQAWCWGLGEDGQIGNGKAATVAEPTLVTSALRFTQITAGESHTCAVATGGRVWCWGSDEMGQLGNEFRMLRSTTPIPVDGNVLFQRVDAGRNHTCGVTTGGAVLCWGGAEHAQTGVPADAACVLDLPCVQVPAQVVASGIADVQAGDRFTCALSTAGAVTCWGRGENGELGNGQAAGSMAPVSVSGTFASIAVGGAHACGRTAGGTVSCWGSVDLNPMFGYRSIGAAPVQVAMATPAAAITAGRRHSCAVATNGDTTCWGSNLVGAFGDGLQTLYDATPVTLVMPPRN